MACLGLQDLCRFKHEAWDYDFNWNERCGRSFPLSIVSLKETLKKLLLLNRPLPPDQFVMLINVFPSSLINYQW